jgi:carboxylate-amine ligase
MRELARREPTFGLHVHVAVPSAETAVRALNAIRGHLPVLLALSGNSPFWQGRDSGLASARTPVFQAFPRTGPPRWFRDYADYVEAIDVLVRCDAIPEPTFLWWDARLQPRFGTLEVRIMDAQTRVEDTAAIASLVQCLVRLEAGREPAPPDAPEVLDENRFIAARDGMEARLVDPAAWSRRPVRDRLAELLDACAPFARALGCVDELADVARLAASPGAVRQRELVARTGDLEGLVDALSREFT